MSENRFLMSHFRFLQTSVECEECRGEKRSLQNQDKNHEAFNSFASVIIYGEYKKRSSRRLPVEFDMESFMWMERILMKIGAKEFSLNSLSVKFINFGCVICRILLITYLQDLKLIVTIWL